MDKNSHNLRRLEEKIKPSFLLLSSVRNINKGFTIFFAMLVGSLALSVGFAIYDLTVREIDLSAAASQSQYAIYAADTGAECALYWDSKYSGSGSAFGTSSTATWGTAPLNCNASDITVSGPPATFLASYLAAADANSNCVDSTHWCKATGASVATTTFALSIPSGGTPAQTYCAIVQVGKSTFGGILYTTIISKGYNNCSSAGAARLERTLRVSY